MMKCSTPVFQLKVLVDGKPIQEYHKDDKTFVEGRKGSNFSLQLTNLTYRRILVYPTVDGLSAMSGKEASLTDKTGYVLRGNESINVPGWRLNNDEVAQFFFAGKGQSYAEKTGKGLDKGVVACAVWEEKAVEFDFKPRRSILRGSGGSSGQRYGGACGQSMNFMDTGEEQCSGEVDGSWEPSSFTSTRCSVEPESCMGGQSANSVNSVSKSMRKRSVKTQNLGAGFGNATSHRVVTTSFETATDKPAVLATIYYDDVAGLRARGLKIGSRRKRMSEPNPFPADRGCQPPEDWQG